MLDVPTSNSDFVTLTPVTVNLDFQGVFLCVCTLAFKEVTATNVVDKLEGVRFYSSSASTDNEVLSTPFYYSNLKLYRVIGS